MTTALAKVKKSPVKKTAGRPSMLLEGQVEQAILDFIRIGTPITFAVTASGISTTSFYKWMSRGMTERERLATVPDAKENPREGVFVEFAYNIERARADAIARKITFVDVAASEGDWRASAWWLERQVPSEFGKIDRLGIGGNDGNPIKVQIEMGDLEAKIARVIAQRKK